MCGCLLLSFFDCPVPSVCISVCVCRIQRCLLMITSFSFWYSHWLFVFGVSFMRLPALSHLCEYIEDCEHTDLAIRILHLLGEEGARSSRPNVYVRFIYNRIILENASIRAGECEKTDSSDKKIPLSLRLSRSLSPSLQGHRICSFLSCIFLCQNKIKQSKKRWKVEICKAMCMCVRACVVCMSWLSLSELGSVD